VKIPPSILDLLAIAQDAAREVMAVYASQFAVSAKADLSPVTEADARAEKVILAGLATSFPGLPVLAEEQASAGAMQKLGSRFFLVDPLDGTKEFISRNGEFTINIALSENGRVTEGVVYAPAIGKIYWGKEGAGAAQADLPISNLPSLAAWNPLQVRPRPAKGLKVVASRSHLDKETEAYLETLPSKTLVSAGSSLKFCLVAAGDADLYPRFGRTMEWDTAAGQAVLEAAGGRVETLDGKPLTYGKAERGYDNPAFIASA
jgi:3'(2'), 5'-bisphosphate nucleotidase